MKPLLVTDYVQSGDVLFEYRDYAFRGPQAVRAAEAAACAADQGAFWAFHDTLFLNQGAANAFSDARLKAMAETLGLDTAAFNACLDSGEKLAQVEASLEEGRSQGIDSTPSLFVNGVEVPWQGWETLKQAIDASLQEG